MPIYEYQCQSCNGEIERLQKLSDEPLLDCPLCGEPSLKRKISAAGFRLKGGGWYETDFKKSGKKNLAGDGGGEGVLRVRVEHALQQPFAIAQVDEDHAAVIAPAVGPSAQRDFLAGVRGAQVAAVVGAHESVPGDLVCSGRRGRRAR